jgi:hypothetical protein
MFPLHAKASLVAAVPLVAAIALVTAGCGTASAPAGAAGTTPTAGAPTTSAPPSPSSPSSPASPSPTVPPPTGPVIPIASGPATTACTGWPASVTYETLPASFTPVSVIRCVADEETIPGKGEWLVATLQRADTGLTPLIDALRQPTAHTTSDTICPEYVILPPQIVLVSSDGQMLRPRLPADDCGHTDGQVLTALAALPWKATSERLVSPVKSNS